MIPPEHQTNGASPSRAGGLILILICAVACLIRLGVAFSGKATWYNTDTYMYLDMARAITEGKPSAAAPNGYPLMIVLVQEIVGASRLPAALVGLNVLLSTLTVFLCYGIGSAISSRWTGLLAAALMAIWPNQINYMRQILSETPSTFFLVLGFWLIVRQRYGPGGACLYAAALIRSTLLPVAVLVLFWTMVFRERKAGVVRYAAGLAAVFLMNFTLMKLHVVSPPTNAGDNLLIAVQPGDMREFDFTLSSFTPEQKAHPLRTYLSAFAAAPGTFIAHRAYALWALWGPWPEPGDKHAPRSVVGRCIIGLRFPLVILALVELYRRRGSAFPWLMMIPILVVTLIHTAFFSTPRFSYCAEPFAIVLCALLATRAYPRGMGEWRGDAPQPAA